MIMSLYTLRYFFRLFSNNIDFLTVIDRNTKIISYILKQVNIFIFILIIILSSFTAFSSLPGDTLMNSGNSASLTSVNSTSEVEISDKSNEKSNSSVPYTILISFDGLRYDFESIFSKYVQNSVLRQAQDDFGRQQTADGRQELITNYELRIMNDDTLRQAQDDFGRQQTADGRQELITNYELRIMNDDTLRQAQGDFGRQQTADGRQELITNYELRITNEDTLFPNIKSKELANFKYIEVHGVKASSLKPVFPTTTLPNHYSILSGMYPVNHGIIVNSFKDPFYHDYFSSNSKGSRKLSKWYIAENFFETCRRQGVKTGSCYWTCPELEDELKNPDYLIEFDGSVSYFDRIDEGFEWLEMDYDERPKFISFYFEEADIKSLLYGTESDELGASLVLIDSIVGYFFERLRAINLFDSTNIIIVSDHGNLDIDSNNFINIDEILTGIRYELQNYGAFMMIDCNANVIEEIYDSLKSHDGNYSVYLRKDIPEHLNFSKHPYISPIFVLAKPGWFLVDKSSAERTKGLKSLQGYDNKELSMHGVFYAMGPSFKVNYKTETLQNIDIYLLLCRIFGIFPRNNIDGKAEGFDFILRGNNE